MKKVGTVLLTLVLSLGLDAQKVDSLDIKIGQMIMVGISDYYNEAEREAVVRLIEEGKIGGLVLFEKNLQKENTLPELAKMVSGVQKPAEIPLFMSIDEEGGKVNRLKAKYGFPRSVSAQYIGSLNNLDSTRYYGELTATNLQKFGFNVNFAPTVDVAINPENPVIVQKERSYSRDFKEVIQHAEVFVEAHRSQNVATVLKHFPGHGSSEADTHKGIADVSNTWQFEELYPYRDLITKGKADAVMSAHIVNRSLDESLLPGTLSRKILTGILREHLGFEGVVFSDDMHMGAIVKHYGTEEAVVMGINAGLDVLIFSNNIYDDEQMAADYLHGMIKEKVQNGEIAQERIDQSFRRIMTLKKNLGMLNADYKKDLQKRLKGLY